MASNGNDLVLKTVHESIQSMYQDIDRHRSAIASIIAEYSGVCVADDGDSAGKRVECRELRLKRAISDAIEVLEESRKAFKSKKLEALRRDLTRVLAESE